MKKTLGVLVALVAVVSMAGAQKYGFGLEGSVGGDSQEVSLSNSLGTRTTIDFTAFGVIDLGQLVVEPHLSVYSLSEKVTGLAVGGFTDGQGQTGFGIGARALLPAAKAGVLSFSTGADLAYMAWGEPKVYGGADPYYKWEFGITVPVQMEIAFGKQVFLRMSQDVGGLSYTSQNTGAGDVKSWTLSFSEAFAPQLGLVFRF